MPKVSLCQLSLPDTTFEEDIELAVAVGAGGLGIDELKLRDRDIHDHARLLAESGITATTCSAEVLTVLPQPNPRVGLYPGPGDPVDRLNEMIASLERLAVFQPEAVFFVSGPAGSYEESEARGIVVDALRRLAEVASGLGTQLGIEPMRPSVRSTWTILGSLDEAVSLLDDVGDENVGIVFDTWHMWDTPNVHDAIASVADRIVGVQVADYRDPPRGPRDRLFPGDGVADIPSLLETLRRAGYSGWYDLEVFSDDGRFGHEYEDSLWKLGPRLFAEGAVKGFLRCWESTSPGDAEASAE